MPDSKLTLAFSIILVRPRAALNLVQHPNSTHLLTDLNYIVVAQVDFWSSISASNEYVQVITAQLRAHRLLNFS